jgi:predicted nuclease with TOPRIM domain
MYFFNLLSSFLVDRLEVKYDQATKELDNIDEEIISLEEKLSVLRKRAVRKRKEWRRLRTRFYEAVNHENSTLQEEDLAREAVEAASVVGQGASMGYDPGQELEVDPEIYQALLAQMGAQGSTDL